MEKPEILGVNALACIAVPATAIAALGLGEAAALLAAACAAPAWVAEGGGSLVL